MKRAVKALFIIVYFAVLIYIFACMAISGHVDFDHMNIYFGEVPEGTAFADILVKGRAEDREIDFNVSNGYVLKLDSDCELAKYNEDGYASLLLRTGLAVLEDHELSPETSDKHSCLGLETGDDDIFDHIHHIKVAYCDKDGNILGITEEAEVKSVLFGMPEYTIKADGNKVKLDAHVSLPFFWGVVLPAIAGAILLLVMIIMAVKEIKKAKTSKSGK